MRGSLPSRPSSIELNAIGGVFTGPPAEKREGGTVGTCRLRVFPLFGFARAGQSVAYCRREPGGPTQKMERENEDAVALVGDRHSLVVVALTLRATAGAGYFRYDV